jgi:hypothetical protein
MSAEPVYAGILALIIGGLVGGYLANRRFEDAARHRRQIMQAIIDLEEKMTWVLAHVHLSEKQSAALKEMNERNEAYRDPRI